MWFVALCTVAAVFFLAIKFGKKFMKRLIGMDWLVDIMVTVFFMWIFAVTGTISGLITGIMAGLIFSVVLLMLRFLFPHQRLTRKGWVDRDGILVEKLKESAGKAANWGSNSP
jgi:MFS superfamily sulfate permease-like transporter